MNKTYAPARSTGRCAAAHDAPPSASPSATARARGRTPNSTRPSRARPKVLRGLGLERGDRVGAYGHNSDAYLIGFLACSRAGLVHVPVNQNLTGDDLSYIVGQSGCALVLTDPDLAHRLPAGVRTLALRDADDSLLARIPSAEPYDGPQPDADDLVQLLYTSGTTALPKGAMMSHRALVHEYVSAIHALGLTETDRPVHSLPLYHSAQMHVFLLPYLAVGAQNTILDAPDAAKIFDLVEAGAPTASSRRPPSGSASRSTWTSPHGT